jgi:hypothetical protein
MGECSGYRIENIETTIVRPEIQPSVTMRRSKSDWAIGEETPHHLARVHCESSDGIRSRGGYVHEVPRDDGLVAVVEIQSWLGPSRYLAAKVSNPLQVKLCG